MIAPHPVPATRAGAAPRRRTGVLLGLGLVAGLAACGTSAATPVAHSAHQGSSSQGSHTATGSTTTSVVGTTTVPPTTTVPTGDPSFAPALFARGGTSATLFVLGTARCGPSLCVQLWRGSGGPTGTAHFARVSAPPSTAPTYAGSAGSVSDLVFANASDGFAIERAASGVTAFSTTDGGASWTAQSFGANVDQLEMAASDDAFYAALDRCVSVTDGGLQCQPFELEASAAGSGSWTSSTVPGTGDQGGVAIGLAADRTDVWLTYQPSSGDLVPQLLEAAGGHAPFVARDEPQLGSVAACSLDTVGGTIWAKCPTGMMVSWWTSTDGGVHFRSFWGSGGTDGSAFTAVDGQVAYRYLGILSGQLQATADGGATFTTVGRLPFVGGTPELLFFDRQDGLALGVASPSGNAQAEAPTLLQTADGGHDWTVVKV